MFPFTSVVCIFSSHSIISLHPLYPFSTAIALLLFSPKLPLKTYLETQIYLNLTVIAILFPKKSQEKNQMTVLMDSHTKRLIAVLWKTWAKWWAIHRMQRKLELVVFAMCKLLDICKYPHAGMVNWEQPSGCLATFFTF